MRFDDLVAASLSDVAQRGLLRNPRVLAGIRGATAAIAGREVVVMCSNDYLGLAGHPHLADAIASGAQEHGAGSGASRHISGTSTIHVDAEACLAGYVGLPAALLFSTGYAANVGVIQALVGPDDVVFSDALNHASLIDGCRLSRAKVVIYPHGDASELARLLEQHRAGARAAVVVTESVFSMDGDVAPLSALAELARKHRAGLLVDEAHALGIFGPSGRGACAAAGIVPDILVGTLGKSLGLAGAFVSGTPDTVRLVQNLARSYIFSTAPSPALAAAIPVAVELARSADERRTILLQHAAALRSHLASLGYRVQPGPGPIIPIHVGPHDETMQLSGALLEHGVFVHGIRPPTVPPGTSRLRLTPTAAHDEHHIAQVKAAFAALATRYKRIALDTGM